MMVTAFTRTNFPFPTSPPTMKSVLATLAAVGLAVSSALAQLTINTPSNPVVCQPLLLTWSGGTPPYFLVRISAQFFHTKSNTCGFIIIEPNAPSLHDFGQVEGNSLTWTVNIAAGTSIGLTLRDSTGTTAQSAPFNINAGGDTSCVGKDPSTSTGPTTAGNTSGSGTSTAPTSTSAPTTTTPAAPTTTAPTTTAPNPSNTSKPAASSTGTSSAPSSTNAATTRAVEFGAAAVVGAAVIALLA
ncbi:hypothetical protein D9615_004358 [Tricholomella constricta]|uniref:Uncharacterized protein n=1 Tax=Tricholomella constricta TaxID=117010 RepID=A0A8H5HEL7_9AGAR|nr:hypothetical protein D9615_004358 [Tricholomella constricta]